MLVIAGIVYIVSAGDEGMMTTAKGLLKNAVIGFAIILGAWLIVNTVLWIIGTKEKEHPEGGTLGIQIDSWNNFSCSTQSSAGTGSEPGQSDTSTPPKNETKGCGVTGKGKCFSGVVGSVSCPSGYSPTLGNPLNSCPSGQVCCEENGLPKDSEGRCGINNAGECKDGIVSCPSGWTATMGNIQNPCKSGSKCCVKDGQSEENCRRAFSAAQGVCFYGMSSCPDGFSKILFGTCSASQSVCCKKNN
jgi:hypothetical protein